MNHQRASLAGAALVLTLALASLLSIPGSPLPAAGQAVECYSLAGVWDSLAETAPAGYVLDPAGVAVDRDGTVYLADAGRSQIHVFSGDSFVRTWGEPGSELGQLMEPRGLTLMGDRLLVADTGNRRVQVFSKQGEYIAAWGGVGRPWDVAVAGDDTVLVTDREGSRVIKLDADGLRVGEFGRTGSEPGSLDGPQGITAWPDGRLAVADTGNGRIQVWNADGEVLGLITGTTLLPLVDVAAMGDNNVLVVGLRTISNYLVDSGRLQATSRSPVPGSFSSVAVQPSASAAITPTAYASVRHGYLTGMRRFTDYRLQRIEDWLSLPGPAGELDSPRRLTTGGEMVYLLDAWPRVQRLAQDGTPLDQANVDEVSDIEPHGPSAAFVSSGSSVRRLVGVEEDWAWRAMTETAWIGGLAHLADRRLVIALDLPGQRLLQFDYDGRAVLSPTLGTGAFHSLSDLTGTRDGRLLLVNRTRSELEVRSYDGQLQDRWPITGVPLRVAAGADGGAFVLTREGWVWKLGPTGLVETWWDAGAAPKSGGAGRRGTPTDLAVDGSGRVLVADGRHDRILVYEPDPNCIPDPAPSRSGCTFVRDKWASPSRIRLGETVGVTLSVAGRCLDEGQGADIVLVVDRSGSMIGRKMEAARNAAISFVGEMDFQVSRVGVVVFNLDATAAISLSNQPADVVGAVVGFGPAVGGTDIGEGIQLAARELAASGRPDVPHYIIVMSDGRPEGDVVDADEAAEAAKAEGAQIVSVGFGTDSDPELMMRLASTPQDYFFAPGSAELAAIYTEIARRITGGITMHTATITDVVPVNMLYLVGSATPPVASYDDRVLRWELTGVRGDFQLHYRLQPLQVGKWPTNVEARSRYVDGHDIPGQLRFPVPEVTVYAPPHPIYLPLVGGRICRPSRVYADVVLVIDASSSMTGEKIEAARSAAQEFLAVLRLPQDHAAVVAFNHDAYLRSRLRGDAIALKAALDSISIERGTVVDAGLDLAVRELTGERARRGTNKVIVVMTDGQNNAGRRPVLDAAQAAKDQGILIFTVAFGANADVELMRQAASSRRHFYRAVTAADLVRIYSEIAYILPCP